MTLFSRGDRVEFSPEVTEVSDVERIGLGPHEVSWAGRMSDGTNIVMLTGHREIWWAHAFRPAEKPPMSPEGAFLDFNRKMLRQVTTSMGLAYDELTVQWTSPARFRVVGRAIERLEVGETVAFDPSTGEVRRALPSDCR